MTARLALAALAVIGVAACSTRDHAALDDQRCIASGAPPGSEAYADCRTRLFIVRKYGPTAP